MNRLVLFETALKAKRKGGFDLPVQNKYLKDGNLNKDGNLRYGEPIDYNNFCFQDDGRKYTSAPYQEELKNWLRVMYQISIEVYKIGKVWSYDLCSTTGGANIMLNTPDFETYEEALEDGLLQALERI